MSGMGMAMMGTGIGRGRRTARSTRPTRAISSPLLEDASVKGARGVIINVTGGPDMSLIEVNEASAIIQEAAHEDANIIFGAVVDPTLEGKVKITVIATGFDRPARRDRRRRPSAVQTPVDLQIVHRVAAGAGEQIAAVGRRRLADDASRGGRCSSCRCRRRRGDGRGRTRAPGAEFEPVSPLDVPGVPAAPAARADARHVAGRPRGTPRRSTARQVRAAPDGMGRRDVHSEDPRDARAAVGSTAYDPADARASPAPCAARGLRRSASHEALAPARARAATSSRAKSATCASRTAAGCASRSLPEHLLRRDVEPRLPDGLPALQRAGRHRVRARVPAAEAGAARRSSRRGTPPRHARVADAGRATSTSSPSRCRSSGTTPTWSRCCGWPACRCARPSATTARSAGRDRRRGDVREPRAAGAVRRRDCRRRRRGARARADRGACARPPIAHDLLRRLAARARLLHPVVLRRRATRADGTIAALRAARRHRRAAGREEGGAEDAPSALDPPATIDLHARHRVRLALPRSRSCAAAPTCAGSAGPATTTCRCAPFPADRILELAQRGARRTPTASAWCRSRSAITPTSSTS